MGYIDRPNSPLSPPEYAEGSRTSQEEAEDKALIGKATNRQPFWLRKKSIFSRLNLTLFLFLNLVLTTLNFAILLYWTILWQKSPAPRGPDSSVSSTSSLLPPSPAISAVERELRPFTLTSPYDQHPGPETDKLWHDLVNTGAMFPLTKEEFFEVNDSPETGIKFTHDPQGRYLGTLASTHQIHCVDSLRKGLWFHYKHYQAAGDSLFIDKDPPEEHLMHCVEMLRNAVMCFGDVSLVTYNWKRGHEGPKASFKSMHSCQKWNRIKEWRSSHNVTEQIKTLERPVGLLDIAEGEDEDDASIGYGA
ncbi:hypothetical protein F4818DRAFT_426281 [Hypoxylon cercidicola]|nr:hypothetical protein F4818DRAFT_426281 [Hypoxylon cercidicola]